MSASGRCMRSITSSTWGGIAWLVSSEMTIMTTNASGTVQTAGWPSSAAPQPCAAAPSIVATIAQKQAPPPTTTPAVAPIQVRRPVVVQARSAVRCGAGRGGLRGQGHGGGSDGGGGQEQAAAWAF